MSNNERLRIAIVGAGIGGLTLSSALGFMDKERRLEIKIYEASKRISEIGAGINFWPRTWQIMKAIGLEDKLLEFLPRVPDDSTRIIFQVRKGDQCDGLHIQDLTMKGGSVRFHRADLHQALMSRMDGQLQLSRRLVSYEESESEVRLYFQNGVTETCDLLVGMDGIKSAVRKEFLRKHNLFKSPSFNPIWSGDIAYRGLIPADSLQAEFPGHRALNRPMIYCGKLKHVVVYPVSHDKLVNVVAFVGDPSKEGTVYEGPTTTNCMQEEVLSAFQAWEPEVQALLRCIKQPTKWAIQALRPMERYSSGRIIIAGDAAHGMTPHQGSGAGQAVEDAYILASLIASDFCTKSTISSVSEVYNTIRCPAGNRVLDGSRTSGRLCQLVAPGFEDVAKGDTQVPLDKLVNLFDVFSKNWEWVWKESAEDDKNRALELLKSIEGI